MSFGLCCSQHARLVSGMIIYCTSRAQAASMISITVRLSGTSTQVALEPSWESGKAATAYLYYLCYLYLHRFNTDGTVNTDTVIDRLHRVWIERRAWNECRDSLDLLNVLFQSLSPHLKHHTNQQVDHQGIQMFRSANAALLCFNSRRNTGKDASVYI